MTRSFFSTYRIGFLGSGLGLALLFVSLVQIGQPQEATLLERMQGWGVLAAFGLLATVVGFGVMNVGAVRSGNGYASLDPAQFSEDVPEQVEATARAKIVAASVTDESPLIDRTPKCIACGADNRLGAVYCDQCGERL